MFHVANFVKRFIYFLLQKFAWENSCEADEFDVLPKEEVVVGGDEA